MPNDKLQQPNFPIGEKPYLSPNPHDKKTEYENRGQETPVVVVTPARPQIDPTEESKDIEDLHEYVEGEIADLKTAVQGKIPLTDKSTAIGENPSQTKLPTEEAVANYVASYFSLHFGEFASLIAPAYSTSQTYALGALVVYGKKLYVCTTAIETAEEWTAGHWTETTVSAQLG